MADLQALVSQFRSDQFVESVGAIAFKVSTREICLLYLIERDEYILAKGRRNCDETHRETALRELMEETGYNCRLVPVRMSTRAPPAVETEPSKDMPRTVSGLIEPFTLQIRPQGKNHIKIIWWYIAAIEEDEPSHNKVQAQGEPQFRVAFFGLDEALSKLSFDNDRDMVRDAIRIFEDTYRWNQKVL